MTTINPAVTYPLNPGGQWTQNHSGAIANPTTPYSGTFIPTLWSGKLAKKFYATTVFSGITNTDWSGEVKNVGDKVIINTIPDINVNDYQIGNDLVYQVPQGKTMELVVNHGQYFAVHVNDVLEYQSKIPLMNTFTDDASMKMKLRIDKLGLYEIFFDATGNWVTATDGYGGLLTTNYGANAGAISAAYNLGTDTAPVAMTSADIVSHITSLSTVLDEANVPEDGRFLVISPFERQLLMNSELKNVYVTGDSQSTLRNGKIGRIDRFDIYVSNQLPKALAGMAWDNTTALASAAKRHLIFAGQRSAVSFASQIAKVESVPNPNDFGKIVRGLNIWGMKVTKGDALAPLVVAG